jgi:PKD repeat protein
VDVPHRSAILESSRRHPGRLLLVPFFSALLVLSLWGLAAPPTVRCHAPGFVGCPGGFLGSPTPLTGSGDQYFQVKLFDYGFWIVDTTAGTNESDSWVLYEGFTIHVNVTSLAPDSSKGGTADHGLGIGAPIDFVIAAPAGTWTAGSFVAPRTPQGGIELYCSHYCGSAHYGMYEDIVSIAPGPNAPHPTASADPLFGTAPLTVGFSGGATGGVPPYTYSWDFGDGAAATTQNASHDYTFPGVYYAHLLVRDSQNLAAGATPLAINVTAPSALDLVANGTPLHGPAPLPVSFTAVASGGTPPYRIDWSFGDGGNGSGISTAHTYSIPGLYVATARVTDSSGASVPAIVQVTVTGTGGSLGLTISVLPVRGDVPLSVNASASVFGGTGPYGAVDWSWGDFVHGFGTTLSHVYRSAGSFYVLATTVDASGNTSNASLRVIVAPVPAGSLEVSPKGSGAPESVGLFANLTGGTAPFGPFRWSFGDNSSTIAGPRVEHLYRTTGEYRMSVTTNDSVGRTISVIGWVNLTGPTLGGVAGAEGGSVLLFLGATGALGLFALVVSARWEGDPRSELRADEGSPLPRRNLDPAEGKER